MNDTSGPILPTPLAYLDPDGSYWRMSQTTLISGDQPLLERLPNWGIVQDLVLYQLAQPEHLTNANDFSSLPTPTAQAGKHGSTPDLPHLLPTPTASQPGGTAERHLERKNSIDGANRTKATDLRMALQQIGESTQRPSTDGNTSSDDQPRLL